MHYRKTHRLNNFKLEILPPATNLLKVKMRVKALFNPPVADVISDTQLPLSRVVGFPPAALPGIEQVDR